MDGNKSMKMKKNSNASCVHIKVPWSRWVTLALLLSLTVPHVKMEVVTEDRGYSWHACMVARQGGVYLSSKVFNRKLMGMPWYVYYLVYITGNVIGWKPTSLWLCLCQTNVRLDPKHIWWGFYNHVKWERTYHQNRGKYTSLYLYFSHCF